MNQWKCKSKDGKIQKTLKDSGSFSFTKKPHEGTSCVVQFINVSQTPIKKNKTETINPLISLYLEPIIGHNDPGAVEKTVVIGISCVTGVDRLIDVCLATMCKGETSTFMIECSKTDTKISFTTTLCSFDDFPELYELTNERSIEIASRLKHAGVELYKKKDVDAAFHKFSSAVKYLHVIDTNQCSDELREKKAKMTSILYCNLAGCHILHLKWKLAVDLCNSVLEKEPDNVKGLYRRGCSLLELKEYEKSRVDLLRAMKLEPHNQAVKTKLFTLENQVRDFNIKFSTSMKKMFS